MVQIAGGRIKTDNKIISFLILITVLLSYVALNINNSTVNTWSWVDGRFTNQTTAAAPQATSKVNDSKPVIIPAIILSGEKALYGVIYDYKYILQDGKEYTSILLTDKATLSFHTYVFDGLVQGMPLGVYTSIIYKDYVKDLNTHLIIIGFEELK